jgi:molecular chaperone Hsp33
MERILIQMDNYLIKTLAYNKQARILFVENTDLIKDVCNHDPMNKLLKTALGKTVSIATMLTGILKGTQRLSLKVKASNPNYKIFADVDSMGNVRGYISDELLNMPSVYLNHLSIEQLIGARGCIQVTTDIGMNNVFTGITDMPYGNIVDDMSHYFKQSEQTPSWFSVHIVFNEKNEIVLSRGVMAQLLPGAPVHLIHRIRNVISEHQSYMIDPENSKTFKELPYSIFKDINIVGIEPVRLFCGCSKAILYPMLYALDKEELANAYKNNSELEIVCNVCGRKYNFDSSEIASLI